MLTVFCLVETVERDNENKQAETYQNCLGDYQQLKLLVTKTKTKHWKNFCLQHAKLLSNNLSLQGLHLHYQRHLCNSSCDKSPYVPVHWHVALLQASFFSVSTVTFSSWF